MSLDSALKRLGSRAKLARRLGVTAQSIQDWVDRQSVPANRAIEIELKTEGLIKRHELRPDLWEAPVAEAADGQ